MIWSTLTVSMCAVIAAELYSYIELKMFGEKISGAMRLYQNCLVGFNNKCFQVNSEYSLNSIA